MGFGQAFYQVLDAARADAPWAYETLYQELAPTVCGYFRLQGAREPEDLVNEVFLGAFRSLDSFSGSEAQFRSWLFTIAHRRLTDERRRWPAAPSSPVTATGSAPTDRAATSRTTPSAA